MKTKSIEKNLKWVLKQCETTLKHDYPVHMQLSAFFEEGRRSKDMAENVRGRVFDRYSDQYKNPNKKAIQVIKDKIKILSKEQ